MAASIWGAGSTVNANQSGTLVPQSFVGTAGQTVFNLTNFTYTPGTSSLEVFINGSLQVSGRDYTETSLNSFTLLQGVIVGDLVDVFGIPAFTPSAVVPGSVLIGGTYTLQNYLSDRAVSVKSYPYLAKGDGITDDTAAINAAAAASKAVYFPPGTYKTSSTLVIPDNSHWFGDSEYVTIIALTSILDIDVVQFGWYTRINSITFSAGQVVGGSKGVGRGQSLTNANIPTNVGGNNWTSPAIGGLCYKNVIQDVVFTGGQNYSLLLVNPGYIDLINVRAVLSKGTAGNLYLSGNGAAYSNFPQGTTVNVIGGEYTASIAGPGISANYLYNSTFINVRTEGNYNRGILLTNCGQIKLQNSYVENNFALGAAKGDADIVVTNSLQISIDTPQIVSNNANNAIATASCTNCALTNYAAVLVGGAAATLSLDSGWVSSSNALGIVAAGIQSGGRWIKYADGTSVYSKKVNIPAAAMTTVSGSLFVQASAQADTDFPSIFVSDGAAGFVFSPAIHCMSAAGGTPIWAVATGVSSTNNAIRYRLAAASSITTSVDVYITLTGRWQ